MTQREGKLLTAADPRPQRRYELQGEGEESRERRTQNPMINIT